MDLDALLQDLAPRLAARFGDALLAVALFGSHARGDARPDSDVDLYVLFESLPSDLLERGTYLAGAFPAPFDAVVRSRAEFDADITPLHLDLAVDGRVLFDREGYLAERLALVRRRIAEAGLHRTSGLVWDWREPPGVRDWSVTWEGVRV